MPDHEEPPIPRLNDLDPENRLDVETSFTFFDAADNLLSQDGQPDVPPLTPQQRSNLQRVKEEELRRWTLVMLAEADKLAEEAGYDDPDDPDRDGPSGS